MPGNLCGSDDLNTTYTELAVLITLHVIRTSGESEDAMTQRITKPLQIRDPLGCAGSTPARVTSGRDRVAITIRCRIIVVDLHRSKSRTRQLHLQYIGPHAGAAVTDDAICLKANRDGHSCRQGGSQSRQNVLAVRIALQDMPLQSLGITPQIVALVP